MSKLNSLLNEKAVILTLKSKTKKAALKEIAKKLHTAGFVNDATEYEKGLNTREDQFSTGLGDGIAIPHAQSDAVVKDVVLIAKPETPIDWNSVDGKKVDIIFSIALNSKNAATQTDVLQELAALMMNKEQVNKVKTAKSAKATVAAATATVVKEVKEVKKDAKKVVAVTACPTGIAHTYMSADAIKAGAENLGLHVKVETQGRNTDNTLSTADIESADVIILAIDKGIEGMGRFNGKKVIKVATKTAMKDAEKLIKDGLAGKGEIIKASSSEGDGAGELSWGNFKNVYKNLMGGISRMLPFVIAGGVLLGIAFLLDSGITGGNFGVTRDISRWFAYLGKIGLTFFVPILGAYVAYSIVGPEGLLPGFVAGVIATGSGIFGLGYDGNGAKEGWDNLWGSLTPGVPQDVLSAGSGFIGAMVGGYVAAVTVTTLRLHVFHKVNRTFQGIVSILAMPILTVFMTGAAMFVLQIPLAYFAYGLKKGLQGLQEHNLVWLLGIILGGMMAFDMGGPVNKTAYAFGTGLIGAANAGSSEYEVMGIVMIAGMVPPLAIAFSTAIFKTSWTKEDKEAGLANWLMGAFFITEGAIPFAAKDFKHVIPSIMVGSMIAGVIMGSLQVGVSAPHGGVFVFALLHSYLFSGTGIQIGMGVLFAFAAIFAGAIAGGFMMGLWRKHDIKKGKLVLA